MSILGPTKSTFRVLTCCSPGGGTQSVGVYRWLDISRPAACDHVVSYRGAIRRVGSRYQGSCCQWQRAPDPDCRDDVYWTRRSLPRCVDLPTRRLGMIQIYFDDHGRSLSGARGLRPQEPGWLKLLVNNNAQKLQFSTGKRGLWAL